MMKLLKIPQTTLGPNSYKYFRGGSSQKNLRGVTYTQTHLYIIHSIFWLSTKQWLKERNLQERGDLMDRRRDLQETLEPVVASNE